MEELKARDASSHLATPTPYPKATLKQSFMALLTDW
jgi:hypothetical protein